MLPTECSMTTHPAQLPVEELLKDCEIRRQRRSGPGGQHRNKVETGIFIQHTPTGTEAVATEQRSQESNRRQAIFRLRVRLAIEHRAKSFYPATELWQRRCGDGRIRVNPQHEEFPAILAEAIDVFAFHQWDTQRAAAARKCTASQLVKLLRLEPAALRHVNSVRVDLGMRPLK